MGERKAGGTKTILGAALLLLALAPGGCHHDGGPTSASATISTIDIGANNRDSIIAFGDSISNGYYSLNGLGYRDDLEALYAAVGRSSIRVLNEAISGTYSADGVNRIDEVLKRDKPAVMILLYGTNDEHSSLPMSLYRAVIATTSENLRTIIAAARANKTIAVLSTLPPVCTEARAFQETNIVEMNKKIRAIGEELHASDAGVILADPWTAFTNQAPPDGCDLINLDPGNHPNEQGYAVLAQTYYEALSDVTW